MARGITDLLLPSIRTSRGAKELTTIKKVNVTQSGGTSPVKTINRKRRAIGYSDPVPDFGLDLDVVFPVGEQEVEWEEMWRRREIFQFWYSENDARKFHCKDCRVVDVNKPGADTGETVGSVKVIMLDHIPEQ